MVPVVWLSFLGQEHVLPVVAAIAHYDGLLARLVDHWLEQAAGSTCEQNGQAFPLSCPVRKEREFFWVRKLIDYSFNITIQFEKLMPIFEHKIAYSVNNGFIT